MKRIPLLVWCTVAVGLMTGEARAVLMTTDYWTGVLPTGWAGGITPASTDNIYFGHAVNRNVVLPGNTTVNTLLFAPDSDEFTVDSPSAVTLSLTGGLVAGDNGFGQLTFQPNITLSLSGTPLIDAGNNTVVVYNKVTGSAAPVLVSTGGQGTFVFVNSTGTNDYAGNTTVGDGTQAPSISFWNGSPFGTGTVTFLNGGGLIAHHTATVANDLILNTASGTNSLVLRSWDAPLTFSGSVTLANNTILSPQASATAVTFANGAGNLSVPGAYTRQPIIFTGNIGESGGARSLSVQGPGIVLLAPTSGSNTYTGGTTVGGGLSGGSLIFGNNSAIPAGAGNVLVNSNGYVGFADISAGNFATQVAAHVNLATSNGAVGVDTLTGTPVTFADNVDLTGFSSPGVRFGTATSAILTGTFKPKGINYQFGNGGGSLYVASGLGDVPTFSSQLQLSNPGYVPLKLYLQGANSYTNGTSVNNGFLIFDGAGAVPASGALTAQTSNTSTPWQGISGSYIGYTDAVGTTPAAFLNTFDKANTWGIIGFDTHAGNSTVSIGNVDLTGFNNGVFLGTATSAILNGTLTPSTVTNGNQPNTVWLTAGNGGTLTVNSAITDGGSAVSVVLGGRPSANAYFSNGTVIMSGAKTYSGGTALNANNQGLTVAFDDPGSFGTGPIAIWSGGSGLVGLRAETSGLTLSNDITFQTYADLHLLGNNPFTLNGAISGDGTIQVQRAIATTAGAVTLAHDNSGFTGEIDLQNSTVTLSNNYAAGLAQINLFDANATLAFSGGATNPVLHGISGDTGHLYVPDGTTLKFQLDDDTTHDGDFGGVISRADGGVSSASLVVDASNNSSNQTLYLHGHNLYSGGTTIQGYGVLGLGFSDSAGSGAITLNATDGGLILNTGVTLTNALVLNSGGLAGLGSFAPSAVSGTGQTAGKISFGTGQFLFPGIPGDNTRIPGILTIQTNVAFLTGGTLREMIQDPSLLNVLNGSPATNINGGYGFVDIQGNLDLNSISASGFLVAIESNDANYSKGYSSQILLGQNYSLPFVRATGGISGFDPTKFSFDLSNFQNGQLSATVFNVTSDGTYLYLNFTPVPEPSTWALLATGLGLLGLRTWRRRA